MRDYSPLRERAAKSETVLLKASTINELLDELEALRSAAVPGKPKRNDYPAAFEEAWQAYPTRPGANKRATFKAWTARIRSGVAAETMLAGARGYSAYIQATGQHLKLPETFFGPDEHFGSDWTPPAASNTAGAKPIALPRQKFNFAGADRSGDQGAQDNFMQRHAIAVPAEDVPL